MPRYVTSVTVAQGEPDAHGYEPWIVESTWKINGRDGYFRHDHDSRVAARRHVKGLLVDIEPGMSRDDVLCIGISNCGGNLGARPGGPRQITRRAELPITR
jgi:hypothetical protein